MVASGGGGGGGGGGACAPFAPLGSGTVIKASCQNCQILVVLFCFASFPLILFYDWSLGI